MTTLLRKLFIRDYKNVNNKTVREAHGKLAGFVGIVSNVILFAIKLFAGIITGSISIIADSINNLSDMASSLITLIGFKIASKPADKDHPYGHERVEYVTGLIVSIIILLVGLELGYNSVLKIINNEQASFNYLAIGILGISILIKLWQSVFNSKMGKAINSVALEATSSDSRNDSISTFIILVGGIICLFVKDIPFSLDGVLGLLVSIFILISGIGLVKETVDPIIGVKPDGKLVKNIATDITNHNIVLGIHDMVMHSYGPNKFFMSCHVEVSKDGNIMDIHDEIDNIEREIMEKYNVLLTVHMDPVDNTSEEVKELKNRIIEVIKSISNELSIHDFRVVQGITHTNLIFDCVLPVDNKIKGEDITKALEEAFKDDSVKYYFVINYDHDYVGDTNA